MEEELSKLDAQMGCSWSKYDKLLPNAALVSASSHKNDLNSSFIGRARFEELITGSVNPRSKKCSISFGLKEYSFDKFEILKDTGNYSWIKSSNGEIPPNAIVGGRAFSTGERAFIGRVKHDTLWIQGRILQSQGCVCYHHDGVEFSSRVYEVLVKSDLNDEGPKWILCNSSSAFKLLFLKFQSFVCTANNIDGPIYVGRVCFQEIIPGSITRRDKNTLCRISTGNREYHCKDFKVLLNTHHDLTWESSSNGFVHANAVVGGKSATGEILYIGRTKRNSMMILGKIQPSSGCMFYAHDGVEHSGSKYDVLLKVKARFFSEEGSNLENQTNESELEEVKSTNGDVPEVGIMIQDEQPAIQEVQIDKLIRQDNFDDTIQKDKEDQDITINGTMISAKDDNSSNQHTNEDTPDAEITSIFHQETRTSSTEQTPLKTLQIIYETMEEGLEAIKNYEPANVNDIIEHSIKIKFIVRFFTDDEIRQLEGLLSDPKKSILIAISNELGSKFQICWRAKKKRKFLVLNINSESNSTVNNLVKNFLSCCLNSGHSGLDVNVDQDNDLNNLNVNLFSLYDAHGCNLMMFAAKSQSLPAIKYFINVGFDVTYQVGDLYAIDFLESDSNKYSEMVLELLKSNSPFPKKFYDQNISEELREFVSVNTEMHRAIKDKNFDKILEIIKSNPSQRHFYVPNSGVSSRNISAYEFARIMDLFEVLSILNREFITPGPFESQRGMKSVKSDKIDEEGEPLMREKSDDAENNRKSYRESRMHRQSTSVSAYSNRDESSSIFRFLPWKRQSVIKDIEYSLQKSLQSMTSFKSDTNYKEKIDLIFRVYSKLIENAKLKSVLEVVSQKQCLKIKFDEKKELEESAGSAQYLNQYMEKQIIIGVMDLLVEENFEFLCGKVAQKLCNYAIFDIFKNAGKPYSKDREGRKRREEFKAIARDCKEASKSSNELALQEVKEIYQKFSNEGQQHAELISIVPLIHSKNNDAVYKRNRDKCADLFDYFGYCVDKMNHKIRVKSDFMLRKVTFGFFIVLICAVLLGAVAYSLNRGKKWKSLSSEDQDFILSQNVSYFGVSAKFRDFFMKNSSCLNELHSSQITRTLKNETGVLTGALISNLHSCFYLAFSNMTEGLRVKLKYSDIIFQGSQARLKEVLAENSTIYENLTSDQIKKVFNNSMEVGSAFQPKVKNFIKRKFRKRTQKSQKSFDQIASELKESKVFILADEIGSGKSTVMKHFTTLLKLKNPNYWLAYVDVKRLQFDDKMIESLKNDAAHFIGQKVLDLKMFNLNIFCDLFASGRVIFIWDSLDELNGNETRLIRRLVKELKTLSQNIQIIAINRESSRHFEDIFGTVSHEFVPFDAKNRAEFIKNVIKHGNNHDFNDNYHVNSKMHENSTDFRNISEEIQLTIDRIESHIKSEVKTDDFNFISSNNPLIITLMIASAHKANREEVFSNFYLLFENFLGSNELAKVYQRNALATISSGLILDWKSLEVVGEVDELFDDLPVIENLGVFHPSLTKFLIVQYFHEFFYTDADVDESKVELSLKLLQYFSNFHDDKLVRNLVAGLKVVNVKNPGMKRIILEKCENILWNFNSTENPAIFVSFFEFDDEVSTAIGSPQKWLEVNFKILIKAEQHPGISEVWNSYEKNHQRGKIYFQLWLNREFPSINSILAFTRIPMDEGFLLDLLAQQEFMDFYKYAYKNLNRAEIREFFVSFKEEIYVKFVKSIDDLDIISESIIGILT